MNPLIRFLSKATAQNFNRYSNLQEPQRFKITQFPT